MKTDLQKHRQFVSAPGDVDKAVLVRHLGLRANAFLEVHQAVIVVARLGHALLVVGFRIFMTLTTRQTKII